MRALIFPVLPLFISTLFMQMGGGLSSYLIPLRAAEEGWATINISLFAASFSLSFTLACIFAPRLVFLIGHIRVFSAFTAVMAISLLGQSLFVNEIVWVILRGITGFSIASCFMVIESWLNEKSTNESRGKVFSIYMIMATSGVMVGQFTVSLGDILSPTLFVVCALTFLFALLPTTLTTAASPRPMEAASFNLKALFERSPISVLTAIMCGFMMGSWGTFAPVYVTMQGLTTREGAIMLAMAMMGGALFQYPMGYFSDRVDRRLVMILASFIGIAACITAYGFGDENRILFFSCVFALGIGIFPLHGIAVAHANDFANPDEFVETSSGLLIVFGFGTIIGPILSAFVLSQMGATGLFVAIAIPFLVVIAYAIYRIQQRDQVAEEERSDFAVTPMEQAMSPQAFELDPRADPDWYGHPDEST